MGHIPKDARWYLARLVEEITLEGDPRNVVHTNLVLVRADSPEDAYKKALDLGASGETTYDNPQGRRVSIKFRGLHDLGVIHFPLEHGAELEYQEDLNMDEAAIEKWICPKEEFSAFSPDQRNSDGPNYASRDVLDEMYRRWPHLRPKPE